MHTSIPSISLKGSNSIIRWTYDRVCRPLVTYVTVDRFKSVCYLVLGANTCACVLWTLLHRTVSLVCLSMLYLFKGTTIYPSGVDQHWSLEINVFRLFKNLNVSIVEIQFWNEALPDDRHKFHTYVYIMHTYVCIIGYVIYASILYQTFTVYCSTYKSERPEVISTHARISMFLNVITF